MKLQNSFYQIVNRNTVGETQVMTLELDATHEIYQAHFPEQPITPGVCIIQIATELLSDILHTDLKLIKVKNVKFLSVISPVETSCVSYVFRTIHEEEETIKAVVEVLHEKICYAKISIICKK